MPITVSCGGCEKAFRAKDELAGKTCKCPACGHALRIPAAAPRVDTSRPAGDESEDRGGVAAPSAQGAAAPGEGGVCPNCEAGLATGAVFCTNCGQDTRTGRATVEAKLAPPRGAPTVAARRTRREKSGDAGPTGLLKKFLAARGLTTALTLAVATVLWVVVARWVIEPQREARREAERISEVESLHLARETDAAMELRRELKPELSARGRELLEAFDRRLGLLRRHGHFTPSAAKWVKGPAGIELTGEYVQGPGRDSEAFLPTTLSGTHVVSSADLAAGGPRVLLIGPEGGAEAALEQSKRADVAMSVTLAESSEDSPPSFRVEIANGGEEPLHCQERSLFLRWSYVDYARTFSLETGLADVEYAGLRFGLYGKPQEFGRGRLDDIHIAPGSKAADVVTFGTPLKAEDEVEFLSKHRGRHSDMAIARVYRVVSVVFCDAERYVEVPILTSRVQ